MKNEYELPKGDQYFVYGSLREGMYNHYLIKSQKKLADAKIHGYKLISLGSYPAIFKTGNDEDIVVGEVYKITDKDIAQSMHNMEIGAGYHVDEVQAGEHKAFVYARSEDKLPQLNVVESGDWVASFKKR